MIEAKIPKDFVNWKDNCSWWGKGYLLFGLQSGGVMVGLQVGSF